MEDYRDYLIIDLENKLYILRKKYYRRVLLSRLLSITSLVLSIVSFTISILKLYGKI